MRYNVDIFRELNTNLYNLFKELATIVCFAVYKEQRSDESVSNQQSCGSCLHTSFFVNLVN